MYYLDYAIQLGGIILATLSVAYILNYYRQNLLRVHIKNKRDRDLLHCFRDKIETEMSKVHFKKEWENSVWSDYRPFKVVRKEFENMNHNICSFYLESLNGKPITPYLPGQHITVAVQSPDHDSPLVRCYTLSESPYNINHYRISVRKKPGENSASTTLHDIINVGDVINLHAPRGNFFLSTETEKPVVMLAGGIGITPFMSMLETFYDNPSKRDVWLFYSTYNRKDHCMYNNLKTIALRCLNIKIRICYTQPTEGDVQGKDYHYDERISIDLLKRVLPSNNYTFMLCGPTAMQNDLIKGLLEWGVPESDIKYESFGGSITEIRSKNPFKVIFSRSKKEIQWENGPLLNLAEKNKVETLQRGCGVGVCGKCKVGIKSGSVCYTTDPIHEDLEDGMCLPCISTPSTDLVLDA